MAYECQNFKNGQILTAECMNKIDEWLSYICGREITAAHVENGELIFTFCGGDTMNVGNVKGDTGNGISSAVLNADYTLTLSFTNGTSYTTPSLRGAAGKDYILTDADKAEIASMAADTVDIPEKLPNPNALTINGTSYDGSKAVSVNIEGGSGGETVYATITYNTESGENTSAMTAAEIMAAYKSGHTVVAVIMTSGNVIDAREGAAVLAPYNTNILVTDVITKTDMYHVLIECAYPSNPENGKITVQHSSMATQALVGTTAEITPSQVAEAVAESRPVRISYTDEWGSEYLFTSFNIWNNLVIGEMLMTAGYDNSGIDYATFPHLKGRLGDNERWFFDETLRMATVEGLPTALPNPNALTINGKAYDGSEAVTVNFEGGIDAEWVATSEQIGGASVFAESIPFTYSSYSLGLNKKSFNVNAGVEYDVYWNGTKYVCTAFATSSEIFLGNADLTSYESLKENPSSNKNAPFVFSGMNDTITMVTKNSTTAENIDISVTTHAYTVYNKLPKEYLPDDIGGNTANIVAFTAAELRAMSYEEFAAAVGEREFIIVEYERPISQGGMFSYKSNPVLLAKDSLGGYVGCAHDWYDVGLGYIIRLIVYNGNVSLAVTNYRAVAFPTSNTIDVGAYPVWTGEYWDYEVPKVELPMLMLPADQLTDGAVISVSAETYMDLMQKIQMCYTLTIVTEVSGGLAMLPVLCMTAPSAGYPATVKCFSPTTRDIITVTLVPGE